MVLVSNPHVTNALSMQVGTSETLCMLTMSTALATTQIVPANDRQWLAGLIDGDGNFHISKKGYVELSIVVEPRDIACLMKVKALYGGSIKPFSHTTALRYRLHHKAGILGVVNDLNGLIQNPVRLAQLNNVCALYDLKTVKSTALTYNSGYLAGLFDSDGSVYYNVASIQVFITVSQKGRYLLDLLQSIYGGKVYPTNASKTAYKWSISKKSEVLHLIDSYFAVSPCLSAKQLKFDLVKQFYLLSSKGAVTASTPEWKAFVEQWNATNQALNSEDLHKLIKLVVKAP